MDGTRQVLVSDAQEVFQVKNAARYRELPLLFGKGAPDAVEELLQLVASGAGPRPARHRRAPGRRAGAGTSTSTAGSRSGCRPTGPQAAWRRLAAEQRASGVITRAVTSIDLRNPDWLTLELPDAAIGQGKEPRA